jgi:hypothetical protein
MTFTGTGPGAAPIESSGQAASPKCVRSASRRPGETLRGTLDFAFLAVALGAVAFTTMRRAGMSPEPDIWRHLRTGAWILQHGAMPQVDPFSSTMAGKPWIAYTWLFDVIAARLFGAIANRGILLMTSGLSLLGMAALTALLARYTYLVRAMVLAAAAYIAMLPLTAPRPWIFTILFFIVELWLLLQACERSRREWLYPIVPLMILWANIHIQFVYGLALIGAFALHASLPAKSSDVFPAPDKDGGLSAAWLWSLLGAASVATLANPYGWRIYSVVYRYAIQHAPLDLIQEMHAPAFRDLASWFVLVLTCLAWFALGVSRRKPLLLIALLAASCWCGFRSARDVWFTAILAAVVLARWWQPEGTVPKLGWKGWTAAIALAGGGLAVTVGASNALAEKAIPQHFPQQACEFIESHRMPGPLYNSYNWGGYIVWRLPEMPVSIDGRANLYGDARLVQSTNTVRASAAWLQDDDLTRAKTILIERDAPLATVLRNRADFRAVYEDKIAVVFQRADSSKAPGR